jgi:hypothetical protein
VLLNKTNKHTIAPTAPLVIAAKGFVVLGLEADPGLNGGVPVSYVYKSIALGNSGSDLTIMAGGVVVDTVAYASSGQGGWPKYTKAGASVQLDASKLTAAANDAGTAWCLSSGPIAGGADKGSPGKANDACP